MFYSKRVLSNATTEGPRPPRRRYLACMYNYLISVKAAFKDFNINKNGYDPYQMKQYADESEFDPYPNNEYQVNKTEMDNIMQQQQDDDEDATFYDASSNDSDYLRPAKRIRTMAATAVDSAAHALLYGTFAAFNFVWSEKKSIEEYFQEKASSTTDTVSFTTTLQTKYDNEKKMRGFGVDFCPFIERPPALQSRMDCAERNLRDICLRTKESVHDAVVRQTITSYGGNQIVPSKRTFDDSWGFVDNDLSVNFKSTIPPVKPQRRVFKQAIQLRRA